MASSQNSLKLKVFLSYASEQHDLAEQIHLTLINSGHDVFFDRTSLPPGKDFNPAILDRIRSSDLFVFLISPQSVEDGAYARTELRFAQQVWNNPEGHVLPVMAVETPLARVPNYLKAVTVLRPEGNLAAEVAATVSDLASGWTPEMTVAGQAEVVRETREHLEKVQLAQELTDIDLQWQDERKKYLIETKYGRELVPTVWHALLTLVAFGGMALVWGVLFATVFDDPFFRNPLTEALPYLFLVVGVISFIYLIWRSRRYKKAERRYQERRNRVNQQLEDLPGTPDRG